MSPKVRTAARVGAFVALALVLTGCIKLNMNLQINSDDTVSGVIQFGVQKELLDLTGQSVEDLLGTDAPFPSDAPGVSAEPFDDGTYAGQQFTFEAVPISVFSGQGPEELSITRQGDTFVVTGTLDLSGGLTGATAPFGATGQELFGSADIKIAFTFPGEVIEANGQIDGNTVTYAPEFGEVVEISATGSAIDNGQAGDVTATGGGGTSTTTILLVVAGIFVLIALVLFIVLRRRKAEVAAEGAEATAVGAAAPAPQAPMAPPPVDQAPPSVDQAPPPPPAPPAPPSAG